MRRDPGMFAVIKIHADDSLEFIPDRHYVSRLSAHGGLLALGM